MWFELTKTSSILWIYLNWMEENWFDCRKVFLQMKIYYLSRLGLQNEILFFIITWTHKYMKNSQSVSYSAIVGKMKCRWNCWHAYIHNKLRIINSAEIFLVLTELSTNFAQVVIKVSLSTICLRYMTRHPVTRICCELY